MTWATKELPMTSSWKREFFAPNSTNLSSPMREDIRASWTRLRAEGRGLTSALVQPEGLAAGPLTCLPLLFVLEDIKAMLEGLGGSNGIDLFLCDDRARVVAQVKGADGEEAREDGPRTGTSFHETFAGTNAIDLCLRSHNATTTCGAQHTCSLFDGAWFHATPLIFEDLTVGGALAFMGHGHAVPAPVLAVLPGAARLALTALENVRLRGQLTRLSKEQRAVAETLSSALLVVSGDGSVQHINETAAHILKIDPVGSIGKPFADLIDFEPVIGPIFTSGIGYKDAEVVIKSPTRSLHLQDTAIPITDDSGAVLSVVNTFHELFYPPSAGRPNRPVDPGFEATLGNSSKVRSAVSIARKAADGDASILLVGESGVGKTLLVRAIHRSSRRSHKPLLSVNCGALPRHILEEELFGRAEKNDINRAGKLELANGGTLFLSEISSMPSDLQSSLAEALQQKQTVRVGGRRPTSIDVRLIASSNEPLWPLVEAGLFRRELFFKLNIVEIVLPPLRERYGDLELLANHFFREFTGHVGAEPPDVPDEILQDFRSYNWPGNIRELRAAVEKMVHGEPDFLPGNASGIPVNAYDSTANAFIPRPLQEYEKRVLTKTLKALGFNISKAARVLEISKPTLYKKMRDYGIEDERQR